MLTNKNSNYKKRAIMKKHRLFKFIVTAFVASIAVSLFAQDEIILDPKDMTPADTGYYIGGVWKDKNDDGIDEFYNGCVDEYGDANHNEAGEQSGFTYNKCMIMPTCWPKDAVDDHGLAEIDHAEGYIQLTKSRYPDTDSAVLGYIITPRIKDLVSLTLETSPDVTSTESRHIYFWIEYSKDNGTTWESSYIEDETTSKKGDSRTYDGSIYFAFEEMMDASAEGPIVIRIMSTPQEQPQRVKIHYVKLVATLAGDVPVNEIKIENATFKVLDNVIYSEEGEIQVYSILGQFMGSGRSVAVQEGIYLVRTSDGSIHKTLIK